MSSTSLSSSSSSLSSTTTSDRSLAQNLFSDTHHAKDYSLYRPVYPSSVFELITQYTDDYYSRQLTDTVVHPSQPQQASSTIPSTGVSLSPPAYRGIVADIACGSGQASVGLASIYTQVIGIDASAAQVEAGTRNPPARNICFQQGTAEATGLPDHSVDAVCVAEALHWFNQELFWKEVHRILKPKGTVIIIGYSGSKISGNQLANISFSNLFVNTLGPYWHPNKTIVDNLYKGYEPSSDSYENIQRYDHLIMEKYWSIEECIGNSHSWSAYITYLKEHPDIVKGSPQDPSEILRQQLQYALSSNGSSSNNNNNNNVTDLLSPLFPSYMVPLTTENSQGYGFGVAKTFHVRLDHEQTEEEKLQRSQGYFHMTWPLTVILGTKRGE